METLAKAAYSSMGDAEKPKNALLDALNEYCSQTAKKPDEDEKSTILKIFYGIVSNTQVQFYTVFVAVPALFIWRHNFTNFQKLHNDNVRLTKSLFHAIVPYREYHTVGDVIAPSLINLLYFISTLAALLFVVDGISDIINWQDYITPIFSSLVFGLSYFGGQALNSWLEKIGISSSFKFQENDVIDIGDDIRGLVVKIDVSYVQIETETEGGGKVQKYVPGKMLTDRIVTIIKKSKRRKEDDGSAGEEVLSDLKESVSEHYVSEMIHFAFTVAIETFYQALANVRDFLGDTAETLRRWIAFCLFVFSTASVSSWSGLCSRVAAVVAACRWAYACVQQTAMGLVREGKAPVSLSLSTPTTDATEPAPTSATPSPTGRRGGGKSPTAAAAAAAASPVAPVAPAAPSRGRSRTPNPARSRAASSAPAAKDGNGSSPPTARRSGRPGNTPR